MIKKFIFWPLYEQILMVWVHWWLNPLTKSDNDRYNYWPKTLLLCLLTTRSYICGDVVSKKQLSNILSVKREKYDFEAEPTVFFHMLALLLLLRCFLLVQKIQCPECHHWPFWRYSLLSLYIYVFAKSKAMNLQACQCRNQSNK